MGCYASSKATPWAIAAAPPDVRTLERAARSDVLTQHNHVGEAARESFQRAQVAAAVEFIKRVHPDFQPGA
jgi:predicted component of type VI protein secretion system